MAATTVPAEMSVTDFRQKVARVLTDAEYGHPTTITREGRAVARVVHPDAGVTPDPGLWQAAQEAYDKAANLPNPYLEMQAAYEALDALLRSYYGDEEAPDGR